MRIINFPGSGDEELARLNEELEAALDGDGQGPQAEAWRELRADVRSLAPPLDPALERRLRAEIERRTAPRPRRRLTVPARMAGLRRPQAIAAAGAAVLLLFVFAATAVVVSHGTGAGSRAIRFGANEAGPNVPATSASRASTQPAIKGPVESSAPAVAAAAPAELGTSVVTPAQPPGRVQQLGASLTLTTKPADVQSTSDGVSRVAVSSGGYVASANVQTQQNGGEANLILSLPSARLGQALAAIARLAPVHAESQSLQDITNARNAARQRLGDARAERQALLRALARAGSEGEIDSLRARLAQNREAIAAAERGLREVSRRASNAEVQVTVLGSQQAEGGGLTVGSGLHDAGHVLAVALAVLLIGLAVVLPLALLAAVLAVALRGWRRYARERTLAES
jgi:hypothetical protein